MGALCYHNYMRTYIHSFVLASLCVGSVVSATGTGEILPSLAEFPVDGVDTAKVEAAFDELCTIQVRIVELLESVKDRETADAAAEELFLIIGRVYELRPDYKKIDRCDADTRNRLVKKLLKVSVEIDPRKKAVAKSLMANDFYGSEDLKEALRQMM